MHGSIVPQRPSLPPRPERINKGGYPRNPLSFLFFVVVVVVVAILLKEK